jgi:nucleoside-diphosphate-sugar epimerase
MKILLTGSEGFIGSHLKNRLESEGHLTHCIDRKLGSDLIDPGTIKDYLDVKVDYIVHLAGDCSTPKSLKDPATSFKDNLLATFNVCQLAGKNKIPLLFTSTCKTEPGPDGSRTPYGTAKLCAEEWVKEYKFSYDVPIIINKPGTIYGPGQDASPESGWLSWFIEASMTDQEITIYGDGNQSRDVLYISDYIDLLMDQLNNFDKYEGKTYGVGGGKKNEISLLRALELLEYKNYTFTNPRKGDVTRFVSDNFYVESVNGWRPKVSYLEGITRTKEYYENLNNGS